MENRICASLYEIANENMQQSGGQFTHPRAAFLYYGKSDPHSVDVLSLLQEEASNEEFAEIAYLAILGRPIDAQAMRNWRKQSALPQGQFRAMVIRSLTSSKEADLRHKRIYHNICIRKKRRTLAMSGFASKHLLPVYRKLPQGMKNTIRKMMGVDDR